MAAPNLFPKQLLNTRLADPDSPWVQVDDFVTRSFLAKGESGGPSTPHHLLSWYPFRSAPNMLFLFYEDLVQVLLPLIFLNTRWSVAVLLCHSVYRTN